MQQFLLRFRWKSVRPHGFIRSGRTDAAENSAIPDEGIVSAGLYLGCKRDATGLMAKK
jgi:hypothetical protein